MLRNLLGADVRVYKAKKEIAKKKKINVGAGSIAIASDWFSCDIDLLNLTKEEDWKRLIGNNRLKNIFAEHVWEHLNTDDAEIANINCFNYLEKGGRLRIAVPDGFHPDPDYIEYVKVGGSGIGADDHKVLYNFKTLKSSLESVGFSVELLEYWDEENNFHFKPWDETNGLVRRSRLNDKRNDNGALKYTSLIIDAIKK